MSEDVLQEVGDWYVGSLDAAVAAFVELIPNIGQETATKLAPLFIAALAREGFLLEPIAER